MLRLPDADERTTAAVGHLAALADPAAATPTATATDDRVDDAIDTPQALAAMARQQSDHRLPKGYVPGRVMRSVGPVSGAGSGAGRGGRRRPSVAVGDEAGAAALRAVAEEVWSGAGDGRD